MVRAHVTLFDASLGKQRDPSQGFRGGNREGERGREKEGGRKHLLQQL